MVSTYLVHHGYCATAESFAHGTGQVFDEEITSIKNRQSKWFQVAFGLKSLILQNTHNIEQWLSSVTQI
jgi:hypothetical protein